MAVRMNTSEAGGFKLLEEDALDDRPCAAVKKFVSSVLERKDMKDADVANSFRNLPSYPGPSHRLAYLLPNHVSKSGTAEDNYRKADSILHPWSPLVSLSLPWSAYQARSSPSSLPGDYLVSAANSIPSIQMHNMSKSMCNAGHSILYLNFMYRLRFHS
ncbi:hypothetical protein RRG08_043733 [Elysia crispata]|uniref:Uncharacterized protein n=1 Tax=Elysia crispata TaxID=231223 RepID=A0AAE0ZNN3_9GAST|nr:hypothetical protein RRG08_043733 [Elysia crispata]